MQKLLLTLATSAILVCTAHAQGGPFTLKGKITGKTHGKLYLWYATAGKPVKDSAHINNGTFTFKGSLTEPCYAFLQGNAATMSDGDPNNTNFYIEPALITVKLKANNFKHAVITGCKTQDELAELEKAEAPVHKATEAVSKAFTKATDAYQDAVRAKKPQAVLDSLNEKAAAIHDQFEPFNEKMAAVNYRFFRSHPASYVTAFQLRYYTGSLPLDTLQVYYNNLGSQLQQTIAGKHVAKEIDKRRSGAPGAVAKNFTTTDIHGVPLSLANFKGRPVLLDFWASWCIPCRHSNPHLKELYTKYHDKGLEIIGVSDDDTKEDAWKKAVASDGIDIWHHVLRGAEVNEDEDDEKDINNKFGIYSLPTKILLDKNGMIVGRYDKGTPEEQAAMDKKIAELVGE